MGRRSTNRAQRVPPLLSALSSIRPFLRARLGSTALGQKPRNAGTSVSAMNTATTTAPAAARPILVSIGMPTTDSPASAMTTVSPAKTTAEPAVPAASPAASWGVRPLARSSR
ncbi:hypothetical protein SCHAM137S_01875 [Streptomyces chartreusis]